MKTILMQTLGYSFLGLGVLGLFLPFLQGFLFLAIGLIILARHASWAERLLDRFRSQHPKADYWIGKAEGKLDAWGERTSSWFRRLFPG
jgi:uncharacterized membrane protein YbaN (DUF454 family)